MTQLVFADVADLLGEYDHEFSFPASAPYVLLYGPNGIGKTKFLELIHASLRLSSRKLYDIPFRRLTLNFADDTTLFVRKDVSGESLGPRGRDKDHRVVISILGAHIEPIEWIVPPPSRFTDDRVVRFADDRHESNFLEDQDFWQWIGDDQWQDERDGEILSTSELESRYGRLRSDFRELPPPDLRTFCDSRSCHLIETQRLIIQQSRRSTAGRRLRLDGPNARRPAVVENSDDMKRRLAAALAENSRTTQQLDRTFPQRILSNTTERGKYSEQEIRQKYARKNALRTELAAI